MMDPGVGHNSGQFDLLDDRMGDWIALSRKVRDHPVVGLRNPVKPADPRLGSCSRFEAWFDLLCLAQFKPARINNKGQVQTLDVGQLMAARSYLAGRWNWTEKTVRGFLATLEGEGMIARSAENDEKKGQQKGQQRANKCNVITICNYSKYQMMQEAIAEYVGQLRGPPRGHRGATEGPAKGHNLTRKTTQQDNTPPTPQGGPTLDEQFAEFWSVFPGDAPPRGRKTDMPKALEAFSKIVKNQHRKKLRATADEIISGAKRYAQSNPDPEFIPMPTTWLNGGRWMDGAGGDGNEQLVGPNGKRWGWWRGMEDRLRALSVDRWRNADAEHKPNGTWPWWSLGPPPGHPECLMPEELIAERGYLETYRGQINHV